MLSRIIPIVDRLTKLPDHIAETRVMAEYDEKRLTRRGWLI
jgi:hypothetical protein